VCQLFVDSPLVSGLSLLILSLIALELSVDRFTSLYKTEKFVEEVEKKKMLDNITSIEDKITSLERRYSRINAFVRTIENNDYFGNLVLQYGVREFSKVYNDETIIVAAQHTLDLWRDCFLKAGSWDAVSYAKDVWGIKRGPRDRISNNLQKWKINVGEKIRRVFVLDDKNEYVSLKPIVDEQSDFGVTVKWIMKDELLSIRSLEDYAKELGSWDFAIFSNDKWILTFILDQKSREITESSLFSSTDLAHKARIVFDEAFDRGSDPRSAP
jgi:hypothetical protein